MEVAQQKTRNGRGLPALDIISKYARHWVWLVLSVLLCTGAGMLFLLSRDVQYDVSMHVLLGEDRPPAPSGTQPEAPGAGSLENETVILQSFDLMLQVVESLHLNARCYLKSMFGRKTYLYADSPYDVSFVPGAGADFRHMEAVVRYNNSTYVVDGTCASASSIVTFQEELRQLPVTVSLPDGAGTLTVHGTEHVAPPVCHVDVDRTENVAAAFARALKISPVSDRSSVLKIDLRVNNPDEGAAILGELVRKYNESAGRERKERALGTLTFVNERLGEIALELGVAGDDAAEYRQKNKIADLSSETGLYLQQTDEYERQRIEAETQLRIIDMLDRFVQENHPGEPVPGLGVSDPELSLAISEYNNSASVYGHLLERAAADENNPLRLRLEDNLVATRSRIVSRIQSERESIRLTLADISRQGSSVYSRIHAVPQQERTLLEKERQQKVTESIFLYLMQKREEANVAMAPSADRAKVVISPVAGGERVYPSSRKTLTAFLFLGLTFPLLLIFLADLFRTTVSDVSELGRLTDAGIIGEIGHDSNSIAVQKDSSSQAAEQFRMLRNSIDYHFGHETHKLLLVTSSIRGEGKTFVGINLAMAFTLLDRRVLLVDTDMRRPNLNCYLQSASKLGLTDCLAGNIMQWEKEIEFMNCFPALHILKAGTIPPNPNELLMSSRFRRFIDEAKSAYDYVVFDSSPVGLVPDAFVAAEYADMTLYVVREKMTPRAMIPLLDGDGYSRLNNLHLVCNDSQASRYGNYGK
ncbi:MAG: polysaccharide biosynthesis tyrosine autokinase [Tannerella sp.]|nr:polysaccharide biosynthesis tyrosine autokinase [Tannerella sp.]